MSTKPRDASAVIIAARLRNQRLAGNPLRAPADVVRWFGAVQAQEYAHARWALAQRARSTSSAAVDRALAEGAILRTHAMRPTWHFVAPEDIRWLLDLTGPRVRAKLASRYRELGLDDATCRRANTTIARALGDGRQMTRAEIADELERGGVRTDASRLSFILMQAELAAIVCSGGLRGKRHTYALFDTRAPAMRTLTREEAVRELVIRYFTSHGPATPYDFSWWSGLTVSDARRGIDDAGRVLAHESFDGTSYWTAATPPLAGAAPPRAHLLPVYDEYLIAYRDRSAAFEPQLRRRADLEERALWWHFLVAGGRVIGGWSVGPEAGTLTIRPRLLRRPTAREKAGLREAARRYALFAGAPATIDLD